MNFKPRSGYCLIKRQEVEVKSGLIWIPEIAKRKSDKAVVLASSARKCKNPDVQLEPVVEKNDTILFHQNAGQEVVLEGQTYELIHEDSILAVLEQ
uniref:Putative chaperonin n=1 Tax=viral metagenome TaxID=1070528 RepID=A0A6M3J0L4_9ZZZZ